MDLTDRDKRLKAIRERVERATPGPWRYEPGTLKHYVYSSEENPDLSIGLQELHWYDGREVPAAENADFIAHAREDVPWLLDRVEELEAHLAISRHPCDIIESESQLMADKADLQARCEYAEEQLLIFIEMFIVSKVPLTDEQVRYAERFIDPETGEVRDEYRANPGARRWAFRPVPPLVDVQILDDPHDVLGAAFDFPGSAVDD